MDHKSPSRAQTHRLSLALICGCASLCASALLACTAEESTEQNQDSQAKIVSLSALGDIAQPVQADAPARIVSLNDTIISSELGARVEAIRHRRGDTINKDDILVELDCRLYRYRLDGARSRLAIAKSELETQNKDFKRHEELYKQGLISEEMFLSRQNSAERGKGNFDLARSDLNIARRDVSNCSVRAPFDATVMDVHIAVGELLQPGARIARLLDISNIEVWADLNPWYATGLQVGSTASFSQNGVVIPIELISKSTVPDLSTGNYKTRFRITGTNPNISGSGEVRWLTSEKYIEANFLRKHQDQLGIMHAVNSRARFLAVNQARKGRYIPVDNIDPQLQVIVRGREKVNVDDEVATKSEPAISISGESGDAAASDESEQTP